MKINLPAVVIDQRIAHQLGVLDFSKKIKERITWRGDEDLLVRVAQQPKRVRVGFARTCGQKNVVDTRHHAVFRVVFAYLLPRRGEPPRGRLVLERGGIAE